MVPRCVAMMQSIVFCQNGRSRAEGSQKDARAWAAVNDNGVPRRRAYKDALPALRVQEYDMQAAIGRLQGSNPNQERCGSEHNNDNRPSFHRRDSILAQSAMAFKTQMPQIERTETPGALGCGGSALQGNRYPARTWPRLLGMLAVAFLMFVVLAGMTPLQAGSGGQQSVLLHLHYRGVRPAARRPRPHHG